ncbi:hypothetical protein NIES4103_47370 [Nostoc sp. NIES-4103]|nr:hypothetical protein NIES4103_47370 [Nostoc sp. NIES-4103]
MLCLTITELYSQLLQTTLDSYRQGCTKSSEITPEFSQNLVEQKLQTLIQSRLSLTDKQIITKFAYARIQGLNSTRQGDLIEAERAFKQARIPLERNELSAEGILLYNSLLEQSQSYLDYCRGNFDQARERILEAIRNDVILQEEYGYEILFLHRIHLVHNLVRIEARKMHFKDAIKLACNILNYLQGASDNLPIPVSWGSEAVTRQAPEYIAVLFAAIISEIAIILSGQKRQIAHDLFMIISHDLQLENNHKSHCYPSAYSWLFVKQAFINSDLTNFLKLASDFLALGRADIPLLWYATIIDLLSVCDELTVPESKLIREEIEKQAMTWKNLPQKFSHLLNEARSR